MLVNNKTTTFFTKYTASTKPAIQVNNTDETRKAEPELVKYPYLSFKAIYNVKTKKIDADAEKIKLTKQFDEILGEDTNLEDLFLKHTMKILSGFSEASIKIDALQFEAETIFDSKTLSKQQKAERAASIMKEANYLRKNAGKFKPFVPPKEPDEKYDYQLINKFKSAINQDNFNLEKVYRNYYSDLNNIPSAEKLQKQYPKIKLPQRPKIVISDKIINTLTRDFYRTLHEIVKTNDTEKTTEFCMSKIQEILAQSVKNPDEVFEKVWVPTVLGMLTKLKTLVHEDAFSTVPEFRKNKTAQITDSDLKLLSVDYDKFVLHVLKEQYLGYKKPNEIKYIEDNTSIALSSINDKAYKFEKIPEKIKAFINTARQIETAKRDYENFDNAQLKERLTFHANGKAGSNEDILAVIIDFDACKFTEGDKKSLFKFLKELDSVYDGDKTIAEVLKTIRKEELRPKETERIDKAEKQKAAQRYKEEQKKAFELNKLKAEFDDSINLLYSNDLTASANICAKYRPENLSEKTFKNAKHLMTIISTNNNGEINKPLVRSKIFNWDTFQSLCESEPDSELLKKAVRYAKEQDGSIDIDKAGSYINNTQIVVNAPQSLECLKNKELVAGIIEKSADKENAIHALCKLDKYKNFSQEEKTHISNFIGIFDLKVPVEKFILKNIIENDYVQSDTLSAIKINENNTVEGSISAKAKQQILNKYKFPQCLDFMLDFEDALSSFATQKGSAGIKKIIANNRLELKIKDHDDRLFTSNNDYCFDVFSEKGLH